MNMSPGRQRILARAFAYSSPVLLGYSAIGIAFGLLMADAGYPWHLTLVMSVVMYAGAGQYIAVGLFAAGAGLAEACLVQLVVNARHLAYSLSMLKKFSRAGPLKYYLIFSLTDETFALLSSLPPEDSPERYRFMFYTALLNQCYWVGGSLAGALAGALIPFSMEGIDFALTALFLVLMIEQILRVREAPVFVISGVLAVLTVLALPGRISLLSAMALSLAVSALWERVTKPKTGL